jgi:hypothetical protein
MMRRPQVIADSMIIGAVGGLRKGSPMYEETYLDMMVGQMGANFTEESRRVRPNSMIATGKVIAKILGRPQEIAGMKINGTVAVDSIRLRMIAGNTLRVRPNSKMSAIAEMSADYRGSPQMTRN